MYGTHLFGFGCAEVAGPCEKVSEVRGISLPTDGIETLLNIYIYIYIYVNYHMSDYYGVSNDRDTL